MKWKIGHWERREGPFVRRGTEAEKEPGVVLVRAQSKEDRGPKLTYTPQCIGKTSFTAASVCDESTTSVQRASSNG